MGWLEKWLADLEPARSEVRTLKRSTAPPVAKPRPKPEIKEVWFQTRRPVNENDLGEIDAGFYSVADDVLTMHDADGKPTGKQYRLGPNDDARLVAARLAKEAWGKGRSDFDRQIIYQPLGIA